jgi:hypothetical protein
LFLELLHSLHVEHVFALEVGGVEIREAVLHEFGADFSVHDHLPSTVVLGEELTVVGVTGHAHHTGSDLEESLEACLLGFDEVDSVHLSHLLDDLLLEVSLGLIHVFFLLKLSIEVLFSRVFLSLPEFFVILGNVLCPFLENLLLWFLVVTRGFLVVSRGFLVST